MDTTVFNGPVVGHPFWFLVFGSWWTSNPITLGMHTRGALCVFESRVLIQKWQFVCLFVGVTYLKPGKLYSASCITIRGLIGSARFFFREIFFEQSIGVSERHMSGIAPLVPRGFDPACLGLYQPPPSRARLWITSLHLMHKIDQKKNFKN